MAKLNTAARELIELANRHDLLVLEDTPYRHLRYDGEDVPTLALKRTFEEAAEVCCRAAEAAVRRVLRAL